MAVDGAGNLFIADTSDSRVRKVTAATGILTTVAGSGTKCASSTSACGDGGSGTASAANFSNEPTVAVDGAGNLYIADTGDNRIRIVSTKAGIDFVTVTAAGTTDTTDGTQTLTLNNVGNLPLTIASMQNNSNNFVLGNPNTGGCSTSLAVAAGGSCLLGEEFKPAAGNTGLLVGTLAVTDNSLNVSSAVQDIPLVGNITADSISVTVSGQSVTAGASSTTITVILGFGGTVADTGAITVKVNGSASGLGTPTCVAKPSHMNCEYTYTGTALATKGNYPLAVSVAADSNYTNGSGTGTLVVTGGSLRPVRRPIIPEKEAR